MHTPCVNFAAFLFSIPVVAAAFAPNVIADDSFRQILTSLAGDDLGESWDATTDEVTPKCPHAWNITKTTLHGGRQEGVELITVNNGKMKIVLCPTRGMSILSVTMGDIELRWDSPVKDIVHPQFVDLDTRGGLGWLHGFNEFMCRCGLESNGGPGIDKFINNMGDEAELQLTLHGRIANIPAREVEVVVDRKAPWAIHIKGQVDEKILFGPKLELHTELVVVPGATTFALNDEIRNVGAQDQEFEILYHANFGAPLLEANAQVIVAAKTVKPINDRAAAELDNWSVYSGPQTGFIEQVYLIEPQVDDDGRTTAILHNAAGDKAASLRWSVDELPYLTVWKNTAAVADGYVTGIEPGTNFPNPRPVEREAGRVPVLVPGASHRMQLEFGIHSGKDNVAAAVEAVRKIGR